MMLCCCCVGDVVVGDVVVDDVDAVVALSISKNMIVKIIIFFTCCD